MFVLCVRGFVSVCVLCMFVCSCLYTFVFFLSVGSCMFFFVSLSGYVIV